MATNDADAKVALLVLQAKERAIAKKRPVWPCVAGELEVHLSQAYSENVRLEARIAHLLELLATPPHRREEEN
jgi:hypothetical protein